MVKELSGWRKDLHEIIFESESFKGKLFDIILLSAIIFSVVVVILDSIPSVNAHYTHLLWLFEWFFTILFTIEYILRLISVKKPLSYAKSFYGIIDLLAILPTYISIFYIGLQGLLVFRIFRLLRLFRILKMTHYVSGAHMLSNALRASKAKIIIFLTAVISIVILMGAIMYMIEGPEHGFNNILISMYWTIVTMTTVGYGDLVPKTALGQVFASLLMLLGYAIIAVPTGIISSELFKSNHNEINFKACDNCGRNHNDSDAIYCKICGGKL